MTKIALFFDTKAARDDAYTAILPLLTGADHGVSGGVPDPLSGDTPRWQLWATCEAIDLTAADTKLDGYTCTKAADGRVAATLVAAAAKEG